MRSRLRVALAAFAVLVAPSAAGALTPTLAPEQLSPGQKAIVKTVFQGDRIEDFDAEIVGVFKGGRVDGDMILARATSERVLRTGVAQGMSGSPVYVEGKLIGALSASWSFSREPLFVVTPIREMLSVLDLPASDASDATGTAGPTGLEPRSTAAFGEYRWPGTDREVAPEPGGLTSGFETAAAPGLPSRLAVPVACAGLDPSLMTTARQMLGALGFTAVPGGRSIARPASATPVANFEPGSAVAVELMRGDLQLAAIGTVTWREGDRVLIFGHPFFQSGGVRLPLASATITTIVASDMTSFKLGAPGRPLGTATQDRRAAVAGVVGPLPHLMPVSVDVVGTGAPARAFRFESIDDRAMAPQLVALAAMNSLLESGGTGAGQTVRWTLRLHRRGAGALTLSDVAVGDAPTGEVASGIAAPLRFLYNNPFARLALDSIAVRLEILPRRDQWWLRAAQVLDAAVRPGGVVHVRCELERWRGGREAVSLSLHVPEEVPDGGYTLWLGGGSELSRYEAQRLPGRYRPASLDEAWSRLGAFRASDQLYASLLARAPEVTRDGRDYPELPISALALLAGERSAEDAARRGNQAILDEIRRPVDGQVRGELLLQILVDSKAP